MKKVIKKFGSYDHEGTYEEYSLWDCIGVVLGYFAVWGVMLFFFGIFILSVVWLSKFLLWLM